MNWLTFDIGTTSLKTALVGGDGAVLARHEVEYAPETPRPGWMEMAPQAYWDAAVAGAQRVIDEAEVSPQAIAGIGFSSQAQSFLALDAAGRPLTPVIVWLDERGRELAAAWEADWLSADRYRSICGYPWVIGDLTLFKIAWLVEHDRRAHRAAHFLCLPDYLIWRLTGERATDYNIAQMSGMLDLRTGDWCDELLEAAGIAADQLPPVHAPGTTVGEVRAEPAGEMGIAPATPVCLGCNDQLAGAIGAGNVRPGLVTETTGTALAVVAATDRLLDDARFFVGRHAVPGLSYAMPYAPVSAVVLTWFRDLCAGADYEELTRAAARVPPGSDGLCVLPHFSGTTADPDARGAIVGLTLGHGRAHIARAIMESCACLLAELIEPIVRHGVEPSRIRSLGGAARSDAWLQMKADMLQAPVERPACAEAASLGAAMLAAVGTGYFETIAEAADAWYRTERTFEPDEGLAETYRRVYAQYRAAAERLYERGGG